MDRQLTVHLDLDGAPVLVGRLWARSKGARESASFEYDASWLARRDAFALDPELPLGAGPFHTERPLFNAFTDPAPDRWGQTLLRRNERARARKEGRPPRTLLTVDFLALVDDRTRLGALRFKDFEQDAFLSSSDRPVPPLVELAKLLAATTRVLEERDTEDDLALLLAPGTSLGGARPKASVRDKAGLSIAKFPSESDDWPVTRWEATALALAQLAGVVVPEWRLALVAKRPVLLLRRFDRTMNERIPFMSALTAIAAKGNETHSYLEIAEMLRRDGSQVKVDLLQLWRRIAFNVLVSNTDDHLRNHGFLREGVGWRLAPAYDLNPMPVDVRPRVHALAIDEIEQAASLETVFAVAPSFGINKPQAARAIVKEAATAVSKWRAVAAKQGLKSRDVDRMASAFEHADLKAAQRLL